MNIKHTIEQTLEKALPAVALAKAGGIGNIELFESKNPAFGDYFTNIGFKSENTDQITESIINPAHKFMCWDKMIDRVEVKAKGFINFFLKEDFLKDFINIILDERETFGSSDVGKGKKILLEFVSANPTGPLNVANGRAAALGDSLTRILNFAGFKAVPEYYIDDSGTQIDTLEKSISLMIKKLKDKGSLRAEGEAISFPENYYKGDYIQNIAQEIIDKNIKDIRTYSLKKIIKDQKSTLDRFGTKFDKWVYESNIRESGKPDEVIKTIKSRNLAYEKDGALWLKTSQFGDEKDRVLVKSNGEYTYLVPDIAYHLNKFDRGYQTLINLWGPDHHGYIPRIKAGISASNYPAENLKIIIVQWVTLLKKNRKLGMSKRQGKFVNLDELISEIGKDVCRYFFLTRKQESHLDFDLDLAKQTSPQNPVYYIQYAYARISSIFKFAVEQGFSLANNTNLKLSCGRHLPMWEASPDADISISRSGDLSHLRTKEEMLLIRKLIHFPEIIETCVLHLEPHHIPFYLQSLAALFHNFYEKQRVVTDDIDLTKARLKLVEAVKIVLSNGLTLLGIEAPEKM